MEKDAHRKSLGQDFHALIVATGVTNLGDGIRLAALPLLATTLTDSPLLVAGVTAAQFLPWLVFGPVGGVIVDRSDRRRLILVTQAWRAAVMAGLGAAVLTDVASIWMLFLVAFVITIGEILVDPSVVAIVPSIVGRADLDRANGQISSAEIVTNDLIGAPVGAGLFIATPWLPFVVDGLSYLGSVVPFRRLPRPEQKPSRSNLDLRQALAEVPDGIRFIRRHQMLRSWTAGVAIFNMGAAAGFSLLVLLIIETHQASEFAYALTLTSAAIGAALSSSLAPWLAEHFGRPRILLTAATFAAVSMFGLASAPTVMLVALCWGVNGAASAVLLAIGRGYVQRYCPPEILGRAAIASRTTTRTAFVAGAVGGGLIAGDLGLQTTFAVGGAVQVAALFPMMLGLRHDHD